VTSQPRRVTSQGQDGRRRTGRRPQARRQPREAPAAGRRPAQPRSRTTAEPPRTPVTAPARQSLVRSSAAPLLWLHQVPRWLLPLLMAALLVAGLAIRGVIGGAALCGVALVLAWLAALSWPRLGVPARVLRAAAVAAMLALAGVEAVR
jgi:hypothetical protein